MKIKDKVIVFYTRILDKIKRVSVRGNLLQRIILKPYLIYCRARKRRVDEKDRFVQIKDNLYYLVIEKCGCSNFNKIALKLNKSIKYYNPSNMNKDRKTFTFIRDPFHRILSAYLDKIENISGNQDRGKYRFSYPMDKKLKELKRKPNFEEFVKIVCSIPNKDLDGHVKPCNTIIEESGINIDFIGTLENFEEDFNKLLKDNNLESIYKNRANHCNIGYNLKDYYSPKIKRMVLRKYWRDLKLFENTKSLNSSNSYELHEKR